MSRLFAFLTVAILVMLGVAAMANGGGAANTPDDEGYTVVSEEIDKPFRRIVEIILKEKVSIETLEAISREIKSDDRQRYDTVIIQYWPLDFDVGSNGPWAQGRFTPELEVRIHGFTIEEEQSLLAEPVPASWQVVGRWIDDDASATLRTIFVDNGRLFMEQNKKASGPVTDELVKCQSSRGHCFQTNGRWDFVIDSHARLLVFDSGDLISIHRTIKSPTIELLK